MTALLSLEKTTHRIGDKTIVDDVSFSAASGELIGLIGPNGAGKSTLLRIAAGIERCTMGEQQLNGDTLETLSLQTRARRVAYLPQSREISWAMTAREIVSLGRFAWGAPLRETPEDTQAVKRALEETGASEFSDRFAHTLSGGELARVHLARTLAGQTPILLLDEPVAALDPAHQLSTMQLLRAKANDGHAIITALHELPLAARFCSRLIVLNNGRIVADGASAEVLNAALLQNVFSVRGSITSSGGAVRIELDSLNN